MSQMSDGMHIYMCNCHITNLPIYIKINLKKQNIIRQILTETGRSPFLALKTFCQPHD